MEAANYLENASWNRRSLDVYKIGSRYLQGGPGGGFWVYPKVFEIGGKVVGGIAVGFAAERSINAFASGDSYGGKVQLGYVGLGSLGLTGIGAIPALGAGAILGIEDFILNKQKEIQLSKIRDTACQRALRMLKNVDVAKEEIQTRKDCCN